MVQNGQKWPGRQKCPLFAPYLGYFEVPIIAVFRNGHSEIVKMVKCQNVPE